MKPKRMQNTFIGNICHAIRRLTAPIAICLTAALLLPGCSSIPPEDLAKLATVESGPGQTLHSVDSNLVVFSSTANVSPGMHTIEMTESCYNNHCSYIAYRFRAQAGYLYRLMPNRTILVLDRNDQNQRKVDELTPVNQNGVVEYLNREDRLGYAREVVKEAQAARAELIAKRKQNLPFVKRLGTRICQVRGEFLHVGFVEGITEDKIQIRVVEALINSNRSMRLSNFTPTIIWDSPLEWDLCE